MHVGALVADRSRAHNSIFASFKSLLLCYLSQHRASHSNTRKQRAERAKQSAFDEKVSSVIKSVIKDALDRNQFLCQRSPGYMLLSTLSAQHRRRHRRVAGCALLANKLMGNVAKNHNLLLSPLQSVNYFLCTLQSSVRTAARN